MALNEWEVELDGGPLLTQANGYRVENIEGLGRSIRAADRDRVSGDGAVVGPEYSEAKTVTLSLSIEGSTPAEAMGRYDDLAAAWNTSRLTEGGLHNVPLRFRLPGRVTQVLPLGRPRRIEPVLSSLSVGFITVLATYYSPDPRILADAETVVDLEVGASNVTLANAGNHPAAVVWDVYGSMSAPGVIRSEADRFDLEAVVLDGAFFRVRTDPKTVTRSTDSANRYQDITGTFLEVPAGGALFRAVGTGPGSNAKVRASYRDTWL